MRRCRFERAPLSGVLSVSVGVALDIPVGTLGRCDTQCTLGPSPFALSIGVVWTRRQRALGGSLQNGRRLVLERDGKACGQAAHLLGETLHLSACAAHEVEWLAEQGAERFGI